MFETAYNDEMEAEVIRLESLARAVSFGHPDWSNACAHCGSELAVIQGNACEACRNKNG